MIGRWFRPSFHVESFLRSIVQKSHINHRSDLSGDHFHERGDGFVQVIMSKVSWDLKYKRATSITEVSYLETISLSGRWFRPNFNVESFLRYIIQASHIIHRSELSGDHFHEWAMISSTLSCREFLEIYSTKITHINHKVTYRETIFMSGRWFRPNFHVESFLRSIAQKSHINHRSELSGDHIQQWAMISSKPSCREFLEIYSTKEPHQSQKWAIWRPFSWVGDDFVEVFMSRVSWDL